MSRAPQDFVCQHGCSCVCPLRALGGGRWRLGRSGTSSWNNPLARPRRGGKEREGCGLRLPQVDPRPHFPEPPPPTHIAEVRDGLSHETLADDMVHVAQGEEECQPMSAALRALRKNDLDTAPHKIRVWSASKPVASTVDGKTFLQDAWPPHGSRGSCGWRLLGSPLGPAQDSPRCPLLACVYPVTPRESGGGPGACIRIITGAGAGHPTSAFPPIFCASGSTSPEQRTIWRSRGIYGLGASARSRCVDASSGEEIHRASRS